MKKIIIGLVVFSSLSSFAGEVCGQVTKVQISTTDTQTSIDDYATITLLKADGNEIQVNLRGGAPVHAAIYAKFMKDKICTYSTGTGGSTGSVNLK